MVLSYLGARAPDAVQAVSIASRQQSPLAQFAAAGSVAPTQQQLADLLRGGQQAVTNATRMGPTTSGAAVGLNALGGYLGGQQQAQAYDAMQGGAPAAAAAGQGAQARQLDPSTLQQILGRKSDRRLKFDVRRVGALPNGLPLYSYRLEGSPLFEVGVMADEVMAFDPAAVWEAEDGFLRVDYSRLVRR